MKYRAKSDEVDAIRFHKRANEEQVIAWADGDANAYRGTTGTLHVETQGGTQIARDGDYLVRVHGHMQVLSAEDFERFYEPHGGN